MLIRVLLILLLTYSSYGNNECPKWLPVLNSETIIIVPIYDLKVTERDFDCDGIVDTNDYDIDGDGINDANKIYNAFSNHVSKIQIVGIGVVVRILDDDIYGRKHQRFILELTTGQTLLVSHNIDLAPKIKQLTIGDEIEFYGEYVWNSKGGVVHWTHKDSNKKHIDGWLVHKGHVYD